MIIKSYKLIYVCKCVYYHMQLYEYTHMLYITIYIIYINDNNILRITNALCYLLSLFT